MALDMLIVRHFGDQKSIFLGFFKVVLRNRLGIVVWAKRSTFGCFIFIYMSFNLNVTPLMNHLLCDPAEALLNDDKVSPAVFIYRGQ